METPNRIPLNESGTSFIEFTDGPGIAVTIEGAPCGTLSDQGFQPPVHD